jgi:hypothetical protein
MDVGHPMLQAILALPIQVSLPRIKFSSFCGMEHRYWIADRILQTLVFCGPLTQTAKEPGEQSGASLTILLPVPLIGGRLQFLFVQHDG